MVDIDNMYTGKMTKECFICGVMVSKKKSVSVFEKRVHRVCLKRHVISIPDSPQREVMLSALCDNGYTHDFSSRKRVFVDGSVYGLTEDGTYKYLREVGKHVSRTDF